MKSARVKAKIKPSHRKRLRRNRYIAFELSGGQVDKKDLIRTVNMMSRDFDENAVEGTRPWLIDFDGSSGIVRCGHRYKDYTIALLNKIRSVGGAEVRVKTLGTSGTIKRLRKKYLS